MTLYPRAPLRMAGKKPRLTLMEGVRVGKLPAGWGRALGWIWLGRLYNEDLPRAAGWFLKTCSFSKLQNGRPAH